MGFMGGVVKAAGAANTARSTQKQGGGGAAGGGGSLQAVRTRSYIRSLQQEIDLVESRLKALRTDLREHQQLKRAMTRT